MGVIGERLRERGWDKSRVELLGIGVTLLFWVTLIWLAWSSGTLEGECRATLMTGEKVSYDPNEPPGFLEQLVYVNWSFIRENCTKEVVCHEVWQCNYSYDEDECWVGLPGLC